ncbi:MAG: hypothetical protein VBE63_24995 [Lamprobacter sp.]|uniref:hypothetical protein n=1 Tax=Lamprobacter sp. TaxID=3100796 RepID=UPI002B26030C|nr:hypothetical protein [Lamprobacter sp.]MEA3643169.1 hypothetical protein [Lamprobacter sp.]
MDTIKTKLSFRIDSGVKDALCTAAQQMLRSIANMEEVLIKEARSAKRGSDAK